MTMMMSRPIHKRQRTPEPAPVPVAVSTSRFAGASGVEELHLMLRPTADADVATQWAWLRRAYTEACAAQGLAAGTGVFLRVLYSERPSDTAFPFDGAVSWVYQPPLPPARIVLWAYHLRTPEGAPAMRREGAWLAVPRPELTHLWTAGLTAPDAGDSGAQTTAILDAYTAGLETMGLTLPEHVLRTWFFVEHIDEKYAGLVAARRDFFTAHGLTADTHYIASTGIEGLPTGGPAVMMDAYAVAGVRPEQIHYLSAPDYLCPTHHYGVTFERGVSVAYRDRTQVYISGTASIDREGQILHVGDVRQQLTRTLENIAALLAQADTDFNHVVMALVYLRHPEDRAVAQEQLQACLGHVPIQVVLAPVCRPGWLIEIECIAIRPNDDAALPEF